jgi:hypothetical protein
MEQSKTALIPIAVATEHTGYGKHDRSDMLNGVTHIWSQASCSIMSRRRSTMHSPGATGQEEHDSQTLSTGVHLYCPSVSAGNPSPGHRIREVEDYTAEFNQYGRRLSTISLGEYVYGILLLCGLLIYDQQEQRRRRAGHYSARFHLNSMVWHICRFFGDWVH